MKELWVVFTHKGREVCAYTMRGTFQGERDDTIQQLANDLNCGPEEIETKVVYR